MDHPEKFRVTLRWLLALTLLHTCSCQQNAIFNQSPFQRQRQQQQNQQLLRQQLQQRQQQQQQVFPNVLPALSPPLTSGLNGVPPIAGLSPIPPILGQPTYRAYNQLNPQNFVPITAYQNELNYDGSFAYGYATGDGTTAQAQGYVKNLGLGEAVEAQVVQGSYSYTSPEGTPITVRYIADENGFRAEGAHIPTPPPIPEAIAKSLQYIASTSPYQQQQQQQQQLNPNLSPYQTPFRQFPPTVSTGQKLTPQQQQQQQQRIFQQQNTGQYQPGGQFNPYRQGGVNLAPGQYPGQVGSSFGIGVSNIARQQQQNLQQQQDLAQQQQSNLEQQQQQKQQQQDLQQQRQDLQQQQQQQNTQGQLATQELRGRPNQLVNPFGGYNHYRRYKKATKT